MIYINRLIPSIKEQLLKLIGSLVVAAILILILTNIPPKNEAELSVTIKLKGNFLLIDYISPLKSKGMITIDQVLTAEIQSLDELILAKQSIIDECSMLRVDNGAFLVDGKLGKYNLNYRIIVDKSINVQDCISSIKKELNSKTRDWINRIIRILEYTKQKGVFESELNLADDNSRVLYSIFQNMSGARNQKAIETDIEILQEFIEVNDYYDIINPSLILPKKPNYVNYFIMCFLATFVVLNIRIIIETLKKY